MNALDLRPNPCRVSFVGTTKITDGNRVWVFLRGGRYDGEARDWTRDGITGNVLRFDWSSANVSKKGKVKRQPVQWCYENVRQAHPNLADVYVADFAWVGRSGGSA